MPDRIQRNRTTGEYRIQTETGWQPYTPPEAPNQPEMYHPGLGDDPTSAAMGELLRTGKEAAIGVARSPLDIAKGLYELVTTDPRQTLRNVGTTLSDPPALIKALADNPREAGSALGQILLTGKFGPKIPGAVGRIPAGMSAAGRGMERGGTALANMNIGGVNLSGAGLLGAAIQGSPRGIALAASPYALKASGKGLQAVGGGLERLKAAVTPSKASVASQSPAGAARVSREVPYRMEAPAPAVPVTSPRRPALLEHLQGDITPAWWERVKGARATPEADIVPSAGPHPEMAARVARAAEANPRRTSLLDELQHELTTGADPDIVRQRVGRAAGEAPAPFPNRPAYGGYPAPSGNPLMEMLPPPELNAWEALRRLRGRTGDIGPWGYPPR